MSVHISVVIATYNQMERLRLALCGLACQRFPKECFEVIVVDDGCTDGTDVMLTAEYPEVHVQDQVTELYTAHPDSPIGFLGFYPHNSAVPRQAFLDVGGFAAHIPFSEGWDLAYRLQAAGVLPGFVREALTYHLYHYHEFSNPSKFKDEQRKRVAGISYMSHHNNNPKLWLIELWRAGIWPDPFIPEELILRDLLHFHQCYQQITPSEIAEIEALLTRHPLWNIHRTA